MNDDPMDAETRDALDEANAHVNRECDKNSLWPFTASGCLFHYRAAVHLGEKYAAYRLARLALRRAIRGLLKQIRKSS